MYRLLILAIFFASFANAQTKKPAPQTKKPAAVKDSVKPVATIDTAAIRAAESATPKEFAVYTKRSKIKGEKVKLCINLVSGSTIFNHCINDSLTKDPEVSKILFEKKQGDSTYVLVYVRAFSKPADKPACDAGKEVKLFFVRWNTTTNKAVVKIKTVESCMKAITDMSTESVDDWDRSSPIVWKYHKGAQNFVELKFDPQNYLLGFQSTGDTTN